MRNWKYAGAENVLRNARRPLRRQLRPLVEGTLRGGGVDSATDWQLHPSQILRSGLELSKSSSSDSCVFIKQRMFRRRVATRSRFVKVNGLTLPLRYDGGDGSDVVLSNLPIRLMADPLRRGRTVLLVPGTSGNDIIQVRPGPQAGTVTVEINGPPARTWCITVPGSAGHRMRRPEKRSAHELAKRAEVELS
jgi:hypothetical protein